MSDVTMEPIQPSKQVLLARQFQHDFLALFTTAEENRTNMFEIPKEHFDAWCVHHKYMSALPSEVTDSDLRAGLQLKRNEIRMSLNNAARFARHGWPPYEITNKSDREYLIRLVQPFLEAVQQEYTLKTRRYLENKLKILNQLGERYRNDERLPQHLRNAWDINAGSLKMVEEVVKATLGFAIKQFEEARERSEQFLKAEEEREKRRQELKALQEENERKAAEIRQSETQPIAKANGEDKQNTTYNKLCNILGIHKEPEETHNDFKHRALRSSATWTENDRKEWSEDVKDWLSQAIDFNQRNKDRHTNYALPYLEGLDGNNNEEN